MQLIDNINQTLRNDLVSTIKSGSRVSIAAASFSVYAYDKFPEGFVYELTKEEWSVLRSKILTLQPTTGKGHHPKYLPKAFTEKGLHMLEMY